MQTRPLILFAHGAGVPSSSPWMQAWAAHLATLGQLVTFDYPYARQGRRPPDRQPVLLEAHRQACEQARQDHPGRPLVLAGKSMGSRISCHLAPEVSADAVVCFGYPLRSPSGALRDAVLRELSSPLLLIQGTRDKLCPLETLQPLQAELRAPTALHVVESGDHSLICTKTWLKANDSDQDAVDGSILAAVKAFFTEQGL
jgi:predicted alpha/beta-hydrolase family hydrolase